MMQGRVRWVLWQWHKVVTVMLSETYKYMIRSNASFCVDQALALIGTISVIKSTADKVKQVQDLFFKER